MKKIIFSLLLLAGFIVFWACEDENTNPVLDTTEIVAPTLAEDNGQTSIVLLVENADEIAMSFTWDSTYYPLEAVQDEVYSLQMDTVGNDFSNSTELVNGDVKSYSITVGELDTLLLTNGYAADVASSFEFRVYSYINEAPQDIVYSNVVELSITPYELSVEVDIPPIYMLGGATTQGWDNDENNIVAYYQTASGADSTYVACDMLSATDENGSDGFIKFVRFIGIWAPQWGSDDEGTWESGNLVYRPNDDAADPTPIPAPDVTGDYKVSVDIVNLTYEIEKITETLFLIGDASEAEWDNTIAIPFTKDAPGKFSLVTTLDASASEGFKFLTDLGAWEPMYGTTDATAFDGGDLIYRGVGDPDVSAIQPPAETGTYLIEINLATNKYTVTKQ